MRKVGKVVLLFALFVGFVDPALERGFGPEYRQTVRSLVQAVVAGARARLSAGDLPFSLPTLPTWPARAGSFAGTWREPQSIDVPAGVDARQAITAVTATARTLVGTPYVYGGDDRSGIDCSGLVVFTYHAAGIDVPHKATILFKLATQIPFESIAPGDLVFFHNDHGPAGHVGIYLGNDKVIHASSSSGYVKLDDLSRMSAVSGLTGIRRILRQTQRPVFVEANVSAGPDEGM